VNPLQLVRLPSLMQLTSGRADIVIGLIDGPVAQTHPDLADAKLRELAGASASACLQTDDMACRHGTFVAGILCGARQSPAPSICPDCTLLVRPIFGAAPAEVGEMPSATPEELAAAILECIAAGARVLNLSIAVISPSGKSERMLEEVLNYALSRGVLIVAAAGNQGTISSSVITRHPWVIPVAACDQQGQPLGGSNLAPSLGRHGLSAPGDRISSLHPAGTTLTLSGTSFAVPFVTGAIALLLSAFPDALAAVVKLTVIRSGAGTRTSVVPPLLDAVAAYQILAANQRRMTA
jgi:subtilisin family serine protease